MAAWFIDDLDQTLIRITDGVKVYDIPKFSIDKALLEAVDGDVVNIVWSNMESGTGGTERMLSLDYHDVADGYSGYVNNPTSATDLANQIKAMIVTGWTNIGTGGGGLVNKGDLLSNNGATDEILPVGDDTWILQANSAESTGLEWVPLSSLPFITTVPDASTTVKGIGKVSVAPASPTNPIFVGDNDTRMTNARTPTAHASTHVNGTDDIQSATTSQKGLLTAADWTTFNGKVNAAGAIAAVGTYSYVIGYSGTVASTNTAAEEALANILIPGGTLIAGDMIFIECVFRGTGAGTGARNGRARIHSATGTGGTQLTQSNTTTTQSLVFGGRVLVTGANAQIGWPAAANTTYGAFAVDTTAPTLAIASDIWINITSLKATAGDGFELRGATVTILKKR